MKDEEVDGHIKTMLADFDNTEPDEDGSRHDAAKGAAIALGTALIKAVFSIAGSLAVLAAKAAKD